MEEFDVRPGHSKKLGGTDGLKTLMQEMFGNVKEESGFLVSAHLLMTRVGARFNGLKKFQVEIVTDSSNPGHPDALPTIQARNKFLERATGYTSKERAKKAQQAAKKAGPEA